MNPTQQAINIATQGIQESWSTPDPQTLTLHPADGMRIAEALFKERRFDEALKFFADVHAIEPENFAAAHGAGLALTELKRYEESSAWYDKAANISMTELMLCTLNKSVALGEQGKTEEAINLLNGLLRSHPNHAHALYNRGVMRMQQDDFSGALFDLEASLTIDPTCASGDARFCRGFSNLVLGDYINGFRDFEHRLHDNIKGGPSQGVELTPIGLLNGLQGKTVLILSEMGNGDMIQFGRFLPLLVERGANIIVVANAGIASIFRGQPGIEVWPEDTDLPEADYWCHMMGLAYVFQITVDTVPPPLPIHYDDTISRRWQKTIQPDGVINVGLCWAGSLISRYDWHRSIPLELLKPLTDLAASRKVRFFGLQQLIRASDADAADELPILNLGQRLTDFRQTAHVLKLLDLVITVDTSVAHMAGTVGVPTWIMVTPIRTYWLWLKGRNDTPWYPSVQLIRQPVRGDWSSAIEVARNKLVEMLA